MGIIKSTLDVIFDEDMSHTKCCGMYLFCCGGDVVWKEG